MTLLVLSLILYAILFKISIVTKPMLKKLIKISSKKLQTRKDWYSNGVVDYIGDSLYIISKDNHHNDND